MFLAVFYELMKFQNFEPLNCFSTLVTSLCKCTCIIECRGVRGHPPPPPKKTPPPPPRKISPPTPLMLSRRVLIFKLLCCTSKRFCLHKTFLSVTRKIYPKFYASFGISTAMAKRRQESENKKQHYTNVLFVLKYICH